MKPKHVCLAFYFGFIIVLTKERSVNIFIHGNEAKISGFSLSEWPTFNNEDLGKKAFSVRYSAPEMVTGQTGATFSTDVWSYGTLIYEVLTYGQRPFQQFKTNSNVSEKLSCHYFSLYNRIDDSFTLSFNLDP